MIVSAYWCIFSSFDMHARRCWRITSANNNNMRANTGGSHRHAYKQVKPYLRSNR